MTLAEFNRQFPLFMAGDGKLLSNEELGRLAEQAEELEMADYESLWGIFVWRDSKEGCTFWEAIDERIHPDWYQEH